MDAAKYGRPESVSSAQIISHLIGQITSDTDDRQHRRTLIGQLCVHYFWP